MSDDDDTEAASAAADPEASKGWSEQDRRTLVITFAGGLAANLVAVLLVGAVLAFVHLARHNWSSSGLVIEALVITVIGALLIGSGYVRGRKSLTGPVTQLTDPPTWWVVGAVGAVFLLMGLLFLTGLAAGVN